MARSQEGQALATLGCWSIFVGVAAGLLVSWNYGFPILLCMIIGLGAQMGYGILGALFYRLVGTL
jgi:hypothetical protein